MSDGEADAAGASGEEASTERESTTNEPAETEAREQRAALSPVVKASLLWGVVGALCFLVLIQGYELFTDQRISFLVKFGVALLVGVVAGGSTYAVQGRIPAENESA
jgi:hypothetical protein